MVVKQLITTVTHPTMQKLILSYDKELKLGPVIFQKSNTDMRCAAYHHQSEKSFIKVKRKSYWLLYMPSRKLCYLEYVNIKIIAMNKQ